MSFKTHHNTIVIGAGLAGLACANRLASAGTDVFVVEATDRVGGRVRTDHLDGFTLDHGFQVLLTAYPACQELLNYEALRLRAFTPGALLRHHGQFRFLGDPWRQPTQLISTLLNPAGSLGDKLRVAGLRRQSCAGSLDELYQRPQSSTIEHLRDKGISAPMIDQFFRPFLGGVFLDESLHCPSRMFEFVFRMMGTGEITVPADGMAAIPRQLAERLPQGTIMFGNSVLLIEPPGRDETNAATPFVVRMSDGVTLTADHLVVAVESDAAARLLGSEAFSTSWSGTTTLYYAANSPPDHRPVLMLRGDEVGPIQSAVVLSNVASEYAPPDCALISVSVDAGQHDPETGDTEQLDDRVRAQLRGWFDDAVADWKLLQTYRVPYGLPRLDLDPVLAPLDVGQLHGEPVAANKLFVCGDHRETPSIQGALNSGLRVADKLLGS